MLSFVAGWYIIYTSPRKEKKISDELSERDITCFLPLIRSVRKWHDRKKVIYLPAFPSYIFVYLNKFQEYRMVSEMEGVLSYVKFGKSHAIVKQQLIDEIRMAINQDNVIVSAAYFEAGEKLVIQEGPLTGLHCEMIKSDGKDKILVRIQLLNRNILLDVPTMHLSRTTA